MCKPHWNQYTRGLARDRRARAVAPGDGSATVERLRTAAEAAGAKVTVTRLSRKARKANDAALAFEAAQVAYDAAQGLDAGTCPYTVGKRTCVAGATGHAGPHEWPKPVKVARGLDAGAQAASRLPAASLEEAWDNAQAARKLLPQTLAEIESPEGQATLKAAADAAQVARREARKADRKAALRVVKEASIA